MKASPEVQALIGAGLVIYALVTLGAAIFWPKALENPFLRPRWWGFGPRASRAASGVGSGFWLLIGFLLLAGVFNVLPQSLSPYVFPLIVLLFVATVVAQLVSTRKNAA